MKLLFLIIILVVNLSISECAGQKMETIELKFQHSLRIPYHDIHIELTKLDDNVFITFKTKPMDDDPKWQNTKTDTTYVLTINDFEKVREIVYSIESSNIVKAIYGGWGEDGTSTVLSFGDPQTRISYQVWSWNNNIKERGLEEFKKACKHLMSLAKLDFKLIK